MLLCILIVPVIIGAVFGAAVFWALKKLTKLPTRIHVATHVAVRLLSALVASVGIVVILFTIDYLLSPRRSGGVEDITESFVILLGAGVPALISGAGIGQRSGKTDN